MPTEYEVFEVDGHEIKLSNPGKVYFPQSGWTKGDLARYHVECADAILNQVRERPTMLKRFPGGIEAKVIYQKRVPEKRPEWLQTAVLKFPSGREAEELVPVDTAHLLWAVSLGNVDWNPHPVRRSDLDHPDELRVDIDPMPDAPWDHVRRVALLAGDVLREHGLVGFPRTSGSRGMHIMVRIHQRWDFVTVRAAALALAREVERRAEGMATATWWREERPQDAVFVDYNQNAKDHTVAAGYSIRPVPDARVACHLRWDEVAGLRARRLPHRHRAGAAADGRGPERLDRLDRGRRWTRCSTCAPRRSAGSGRVLDVGADQALAFRVAGHHLDRRVGAAEAVAAIGLQEYPPGWGALAALRARSLDPLPRDVVQVNSFRGSPYVVPRADARVFTAALVPEDEAGLKSLVGLGAGEGGHRGGVRGRRGARAGRCGRAGGARATGRSTATRSTRRCASGCPDGLLPWCRGCQSHHVRPGFWRALGPLEVTVMPGKATWALAEPPVDVARGRARGAGAAVPARLRAGDALAARRRGLRPRLRTRNSCSTASRRSWRRPRSRGGTGSCSPRTWSGSRLRRPRRASACSAATTPTSPSPTARVARARRRAEEAALPARRPSGRGAGGRRARRALARAQEGRRPRGVRRVARRAGRHRRGGRRDCGAARLRPPRAWSEP